MACTDAAIASVSAPAGIAQNTVSRMIIGGSTGLRMIIALPRAAPPTDSSDLAVVWVISAYGTGTTRDTACTAGIVAWPPQLIMLTFGALRCSGRLTGGQTMGPTCAGVRSIAMMPASA